MKHLYLRPGATDNSGNPVGFKAEEGSEEAHRLVAEGYRRADESDHDAPGEEVTVFTEEALETLTLEELRAIGKRLGVRGYNLMKEPGLREAILAKQPEADTDAD